MDKDDIQLDEEFQDALDEDQGDEGMEGTDGEEGADGEEGEGEVTYTSSEQKAMDAGWVPLKDWEAAGKDPEDWVDAKTFNIKGELLTTISKVNKKNKKLEAALMAIQKVHKKQLEESKEAAKKELLQKKAAAFADEDYLAAAMVDEEIKDLDNAVEEDEAEVDDDTNDAFVEAGKVWVAKNQWFKTDFDMNQEADRFGNWFQANNPDVSPEQFFAAIDKHMRKKFPKAFGVKSGAPSVGGSNGTGRSGGGSKGGYYNKLNSSQKQIVETWIDMGVYDDREEAAKAQLES